MGRGALFGFFLIASIAGGLFFLPELLRKKEYVMAPPAPSTAIKAFPLDRKLRRLVVGPDRKVRRAGEVSLASLAGAGGLLVNFWATWCPPCIEEFPGLEFLSRQMLGATRPGSPLLVAISVDEKWEDVAELVRTLDFVPTFIILHDPSGTLASMLGTTKFPETYWVKPDSTVFFKWTGPQDWVSRDVLDRLSASSQ